jgi:hypothetical protein
MRLPVMPAAAQRLAAMGERGELVDWVLIDKPADDLGVAENFHSGRAECTLFKVV